MDAIGIEQGNNEPRRPAGEGNELDILLRLKAEEP